MTQTPAGWYPSEGQERYWDGSQWTDQFRPLQGQPAQQSTPAAYGAAQPEKKSHTARNILIVVGVLLVLLVGGCLAVVAVVGNEIDNVVTEAEEKDKAPGGPDNPLEISEGEAFEVQDFKYDAGWSIGTDPAGDIDIQGLKVTNERDDEDSAIVEIKFWNGNEVLASADCTTEPIAVGTKASANCFSVDKLPQDYDRITINDTF